MTEEELKKYKEQIERLKREFHADSPENIEYSKDSTIPSIQDNLNNIVKDIIQPNDTAKNIVQETALEIQSIIKENEIEKPVLEKKVNPFLEKLNEKNPFNYPIAENVTSIDSSFDNLKNDDLNKPAENEITSIEHNIIEDVKILTTNAILKTENNNHLDEKKSALTDILNENSQNLTSNNIQTTANKVIIFEEENPSKNTINLASEIPAVKTQSESNIPQEFKPIKPVIPEICEHVSYQNETTDSSQTTNSQVIENDKKTIEKEPNFYFLKFLMFLAALVFLGLVFLFVHKKWNELQPKKNNTTTLSLSSKKDSLDSYIKSLTASDTISKAIENQEKTPSTENLEKQSQIEIPKISDTIFTLKSSNPIGYYAVIGAYQDRKNALKLQQNQKTTFQAFLFDNKIIRVGLLLENNENTIFEQLHTIQKNYPQAWIMYNKN